MRVFRSGDLELEPEQECYRRYSQTDEIVYCIVAIGQWSQHLWWNGEINKLMLNREWTNIVFDENLKIKNFLARQTVIGGTTNATLTFFLSPTSSINIIDPVVWIC